MKTLLESKNMSVTQLRMDVLAIFAKYNAAISHQQIEDELHKFDRVSLYRTLKTFREKGIIHDIILTNGHKKMALCPSECKSEAHTHNHIHFQCKSCESVYCVDIENQPKLGLKGFIVEHMEIQAVGICKNCA